MVGSDFKWRYFSMSGILAYALIVGGAFVSAVVLMFGLRAVKLI